MYRVGDTVRINVKAIIAKENDGHGQCFEVALPVYDFSMERRIWLNPDEMEKVEGGVVSRARDYAIKAHADTNHKYGSILSYSFHLYMVYGYALDFIHLIPEDERDFVLAGAWVHDIIEDARQTYNDVKAATSPEVADIAYACTNEKGKIREDRANGKFFAELRKLPFGVYVKICDRLANVSYSKFTGSRQFEMYRKEAVEFERALYLPQYEEMFDYMNKLLELPVQF